ncbi:uncharacterized protein LOC118204685 [Stegodyphus dumicola]|uniref:uncharacterized protein LOC118204685 n=1 Tax=Stegodyphus dumicola TaxID=202533 RepID=UPI0015A8A139|nr:uncharacterized protein LOC118204685 [Stegodyphus dumicola]
MLILNIQCYEGSYELCLTEEKENEIIQVDASVKYKMPVSRDELLSTTYTEADEILLYETNWIKRTYILHVDCFDLHLIKNIAVRVHNRAFTNIDENFSLLLGHLEIVPVQRKFRFVCKDLSYTFENNITTWLVLVQWTEDPSIHCSDVFIHTRNNEKLYLGTTSQFFYEFKYSVEESPEEELEVLLYPQSYGHKHFDPFLLKIPLKKN